MKKSIAVLFFLAYSMVLLIAQPLPDKSSSQFTIGVFGGLNIPRLTGGGGNPLSENWSSRAGGAFGLTLEYNAGKHVAIDMEVLYSQEGGQRYGMQALDGSSFNPLVPVGTYFYANYKNESLLNYLEVPILANYSFQITRSARIFLKVGPYAGFLLNAKQNTSGSSIVYADASSTQPVSVDPQSGQIFSASFDASTDITKQINHLNFGFTGGTGIEQKIGSGEIVLNIRGAYGLNYIQKYAQNGKNHTGNLLLSLGYSIPL